MKAVTKFKNLLDKKHPLESDPTGTGVHNLASTSYPSPEPDRHFQPSAEVGIPFDGSHHDIAASSSSSVAATVSSYGIPTPRSQTASSRHNSERSNSGDSKPKRLQRILTSSSDKSHAHDPSLDEPLYLGIGPGQDNLTENSDLLQVPEEDVIAESPQAAEFSIYDIAYQKEVERIKQAQGNSATIYLNRRVEGHQEHMTGDKTMHGPAAMAHGGWAHLLDRVRDKEREKEKEHSNDAPSEG
jgi:[calcium/calmodulin-dependent protein kinase] kinase